MESAILSIFLGIVGNALYDVLKSIKQNTHKMLQGQEPLKPLLDTNLTPMLQKAVAELARYRQFDDRIQSEKIKKFLISPEVDAVLRKVYASQIIPGEKNTLNSIREEFIALFILNVNPSPEDSNNFPTEIFDNILKACERALQVAIRKNSLVAHEAKSAIRYQMLRDELAAIKKNLTLLTGKEHLDIQVILKFEETYRDQIPSQHGYITPSNYFGEHKKEHINNLYVFPHFTSVPKSNKEQSEVIKIDDFYSVLYRTVLLGNPGGGKSTLTDKLCYDLATRYSERLYRGRQVTPIHVILRDYALDKKKHNYSILEFIQAKAKSKYQIQPTPLSTFEYLLLNGRAIVFFDGLDELLDTRSRQAISSDVESFCSLYPSVPVLVTSREIGYNEAPLDKEKFEVFRLSSFDDEQVKDYVNKYFRVTEPELEKEQHHRKVEAFIGEINAVPDLRSNPLMLALLCNIYQGEGYIPKNRPDVYEKCALMLFERWDKRRGIKVSLPFESLITSVMMYLAHWIYTNEPLQGGVTERQLIAEVINYLCLERFEDRDDAERAGREFIEFFRGRAWVFTDTGTMKKGERLYQFTHRTFLEYFTARYLVWTSEDIKILQEKILPKISKGEWDIVAQLAFRIQGQETKKAEDDLLNAVIKKSYEVEETQKYNLISFAIRCLKFMVPSLPVRKYITKACIEICLEWGLERIEERPLPIIYVLDYDPNDDFSSPLSDDYLLSQLIAELLTSALENRKTISDTWKEVIIMYINGTDEKISLVAYELGMCFDLSLEFYGLSAEGTNAVECKEFWFSVSKIIFETCIDRIKALSLKSYVVGFDCIDKDLCSITNWIKSNGINSIFQSYQYILFPSLAIGSSLAERIFHSSFSEDFSRDKLHELGQLFTSSIEELTELKINKSISSLLRLFHLTRENFQEIQKLSNSALFAAFFILAVIFECHENMTFKGYSEAIEITEEIKKTQFPFFGYTFLSRLDSPKEANKMREELEKSNLTIEQQNFMSKWGKREIDFVAPLWDDEEGGEVESFY